MFKVYNRNRNFIVHTIGSLIKKKRTICLIYNYNYCHHLSYFNQFFPNKNQYENKNQIIPTEFTVDF